jgi:hypothetical protein
MDYHKLADCLEEVGIALKKFHKKIKNETYL